MANAKDKKVLDFLGYDNERIVVPIYQRSYDWDTHDVQRFIDDILEYYNNNFDNERNKDERYYIGNIIVKEKKNIHDSDITDLILIDGQQRITTIFLCLIIISNASEDKKRKISKYFKVETYDSKIKNKFKISRHYDSNLLKSLYENKNIKNKEKIGNMWENYKFLVNYITTKNIDPNVLFLALKDSTFLVRVKANNDDEHKIFETINSTGKKLKPSDLIKNYILFSSSFWKENDEEEMINFYNNIESTIGEKNLSSFFRYFNTIIGKVKLSKSDSNEIYYDFKKIFNAKTSFDYKDYSSVKEIMKLIHKHSKIYHELHFYKPKENDTNQIKSKFFAANFKQKEKTYYVIAHELLLNSKDLGWNISVHDIVELISHWSVLRVLSSFPDKNITRDVPNIFRDFQNWVKEKLLRDPSFDDFKKYIIFTNKNYRLPNKSDIINQIEHNNLYSNNPKNVLMVLKYFELSKWDKWINPIDIMNPPITIEHVLPQSTSNWGKEFKNEYEFMKAEKLINTIGNLTLLTQQANSSNGNSVFSLKKERFKKDSLVMNREFENIDNWNATIIAERSIKMATSIFNYTKFYEENIEKYLLPNINYQNKNITLIANEQNAKIISTKFFVEKNNDFDINTINNKVDNIDREVSKEDPIFKYVKYRDTPSKGYLKNNVEIFNKEKTKVSLLLYLHKGIGTDKIDSIITCKKRNKGYLNSVTLSYMRIDSRGNNKGIMKNISKEESKRIINAFVEKFY